MKGEGHKGRASYGRVHIYSKHINRHAYKVRTGRIFKVNMHDFVEFVLPPSIVSTIPRTKPFGMTLPTQTPIIVCNSRK